jgi:hypothetical protein
MSQKVKQVILDEWFELIIADQRIASSVELFPERLWELVEALARVAFECGALVGARANPGELEWVDPRVELYRKGIR